MFPVDFLPHATPRLWLRRFIDADLQAFLAYRTDPVVARYQSWQSLSPTAAVQFIQTMHTIPLGVPGEWCQIAIAHHLTHHLLGDIGLQLDPTQPDVAEIGFTLDRSAQGQGYAYEAVHALMTRLFTITPVTQVRAIADARNERSLHLLNKLGMRLVQSVLVRWQDEWCREQVFEITASEWLSGVK